MADPIAERLTSPSGAPLNALSWDEVRERLAGADDYLVATTDVTGRPHVVPVLAVWEDAVCFNTGRNARKARALARNAGIAVTVPGGDVDLVVEGVARLVVDAGRLERVAALFPAKYPWWHPVVRDGQFYDPGDLDDPRLVYAVEPESVFVFGKEKGFTGTRWAFE